MLAILFFIYNILWKVLGSVIGCYICAIFLPFHGLKVGNVCGLVRMLKWFWYFASFGDKVLEGFRKDLFLLKKVIIVD